MDPIVLLFFIIFLLISPWQLSCRQCCKKTNDVGYCQCVLRAEATHGAVGRKAVTVFVCFFWVVVHQRLQRRANGLVLQGPASAMLFVPLFTIKYFLSPDRGKQEVAALRAGGQTGVPPWEPHTHTLTHPPPDRSSRLGSVSRRLPLLLSLLPPLPRRTDRRRENANDETSASALFTCGRTSRR